MEFVIGDLPRFAFGFANPNHAAAAICAVAPFLWGWRRDKVERRGEGGQWRIAVSFVLTAVLCVMLAMTFSRTGLVVLAAEMLAWWWVRRIRRWREEVEGDSGGSSFCRCRDDGAERIPHPQLLIRLFDSLSIRSFAHSVIRLFSYSVVLLLLLAWMWPRMTIDGAILNRPKIWLAGLKLFAANPLGVGFGNSGLLASAFLLPNGVEVRTLVNSHLTMLVEGGLFVGGAWLAFVSAALLSRGRRVRTWIAFAGLALSACSASVFDWHVLFGLDAAPDFGSLNLVLSWLLFVAFVSMGIVLIVRGFSWRRVGIAAGVVATGMMVTVVWGRSGKDSASPAKVTARDGVARPLGWGRSGKDFAAPVVEDGFAAWGNGPCVYHDSEWSLKALKGRFQKGARIRIKSGVEEIETAGADVWLFGEVAESAEKFGDRKVTVVAPPDYYEPPANVVEVKSL